MQFYNKTVSPEEAQRILNTSPYNRVTSSTRKVAKTYADAMKRGEWKLNGECIVLDKEGRLLDGHHRLIAVTIAEIPVTFSVCEGVDRDYFTTYNSGLRTNVAQIIAMTGGKNAHLVMSIINANYSLCKSGRLQLNSGDNKDTRTMTSDYHFYLNDPNGLEEAATLCHKWRKPNIIPVSWIGGVYYYLTHRGGYSKQVVDNFFEQICRIETSEDTTCETFRKYVTIRKMQNVKIERYYLAALFTKTWNAYIQGRQLKKLVFNPDTEDFPHFIILNDNIFTNCEPHQTI